MAPRLSQDMCNHIVVWCEDHGKTAQEIATLAGCSVRAVYYILSFHRDYGTSKNPFARNIGWTRNLDVGDMNYLIALIAAWPKVYIDELQEELYASRNADVSILTISQALHHWEMSNKHVASEALERNELLQAIWQAEYGDIPAEYCVWLDKASVDDKMNQCVSAERHLFAGSAIPFFQLTSEGIIVVDIFEGAVNKETFIQFINDQVVWILAFFFFRSGSSDCSFSGPKVEPIPGTMEHRDSGQLCNPP